MDRLEDFAAEVAARVPDVDDAVALTLRAQDLPPPPERIEAGELIAEVRSHAYEPGFRVPQVELWGSRRAFRHLGLLTLAQLLHRGPGRVGVRFAAAAALDTDPDVPLALRHVPTWLRLELPSELCADGGGDGLHLTVESFVYGPRARERFPFRTWSTRPIEPRTLPAVHLTDEAGDDPEPRERATVVRGFASSLGSLAGAARAAELLLDMSQPSAACREHVLEGEPGQRGVAPGSVELRLVLPGAVAWRPTGFGHAG